MLIHVNDGVRIESNKRQFIGETRGGRGWEHRWFFPSLPGLIDLLLTKELATADELRNAATIAQAINEAAAGIETRLKGAPYVRHMEFWQRINVRSKNRHVFLVAPLGANVRLTIDRRQFRVEFASGSRWRAELFYRNLVQALRGALIWCIRDSHGSETSRILDSINQIADEVQSAAEAIASGKASDRAQPI